MKKYAIIIEHGENNLSAYVPDLPGCITTGRTVEQIERNIREAIELHFEGLRTETRATNCCHLCRTAGSQLTEPRAEQRIRIRRHQHPQRIYADARSYRKIHQL